MYIICLFAHLFFTITLIKINENINKISLLENNKILTNINEYLLFKLKIIHNIIDIISKLYN